MYVFDPKLVGMKNKLTAITVVLYNIIYIYQVAGLCVREGKDACAQLPKRWAAAAAAVKYVCIPQIKSNRENYWRILLFFVFASKARTHDGTSPRCACVRSSVHNRVDYYVLICCCSLKSGHPTQHRIR